MSKDASLLSTARYNRSAAVPGLEKALYKSLCAQDNKSIAVNGQLVVM